MNFAQTNRYYNVKDAKVYISNENNLNRENNQYEPDSEIMWFQEMIKVMILVGDVIALM